MEKSAGNEKEEIIGIRTRSVLWYLTFFGFAINYIIRITASIAIVDMVDPMFRRSSGNKTTVTSECYGEMNLTVSSELSTVLELKKYVSLERRLLDYLGVEYERDGFKWDELKQSQVLGSFFWLNWATQLPGGILAAKYGTKFIFGFSNFISCVISLFMPITCYLDYRWMVGFRLLQGFITGLSWPAMHHLTAHWIPPNERSKFVSAYLGSSIGVAITYPIFGFLIKASSWEWVFHACGICGIVWYMFWLYYVYDSPEKHPRIHPKEKEYILKSLGSSVMRSGETKRKVPWKAILTSRVVWINALAQWGGIWSLFTLLTQAPTYFSNIHSWGIEMTGILSGLPHLLRVAFSIVFSNVGDYLLTIGKISRNQLRALATFFSMVINGFACLGLAYSGCNATAAVFFLTMSLMLHGAVSSGVLSSIVDIGPNYAGITMGLVSSITIVTGFISPIIVGYITYQNQTVTAWQHIFEICAGMLIICGVLYIWLNDTSIQEWNRPAKSSDDSKELAPLKDERVELDVNFKKENFDFYHESNKKKEEIDNNENFEVDRNVKREDNTNGKNQ